MPATVTVNSEVHSLLPSNGFAVALSSAHSDTQASPARGQDVSLRTLHQANQRLKDNLPITVLCVPLPGGSSSVTRDGGRLLTSILAPPLPCNTANLCRVFNSVVPGLPANMMKGRQASYWSLTVSTNPRNDLSTCVTGKLKHGH